MQDFKFEQDNYGFFDMEIDESIKDFAGVEGFETAFDFQVFVDQRATKQDVTNPRFRQGWQGDLLTRDESYQVGSLLWLKNQARNTQNDKNEIIAFIDNALEYLIFIDAAKEINTNILGNNIESVVKIDDDNIKKYTRLWSLTRAD